MHDARFPRTRAHLQPERPGQRGADVARLPLASLPAYGLACAAATRRTLVDQQHFLTFDPSSPGSAIPATIDDGRTMTDISCASTTLCVAVDSAGNAVEGNPVAGTWKAEPVRGAADLGGVACVSAVECVAVDLAGRAFVGVAAPSAASLPSITGTPSQEATLTEHHGTWSNSPRATHTNGSNVTRRATTAPQSAVRPRRR